MYRVRMYIFDAGFETKLTWLLVIDWSDAIGSNYVGIDDIHKRI